MAEVECSQPLDSAAFASRAAAAVATLGSGNSLGPEGPSVELGVGLSRLVGKVASLARPYTSPTSPYICPTSPLHLPYISPASALQVASRGGWLGAAHLMRRQRQLL